SMQPRRPSYKPGMVYAVPLVDGSFGLAQAGSPMFPNVIYVALFLDLFLALPTEIPRLDASRVISLTATWRKNLNRGEWIPLGISEPTLDLLKHPTQALAGVGYLGAKHYDAGLLSEFLSTCHGLLPWNVMYDPAYYEKLLLSRCARPEKVVVLGEGERTAYRHEVLGVGG
ncbi:hypothetical protein, partial [Xanthomonas perforans]